MFKIARQNIKQLSFIGILFYYYIPDYNASILFTKK
jgi:hypothetical protein